MSTKIIFISQKGYIESQSIILADSIRNVYGNNIEVEVCIPIYNKQELFPSSETLYFFQKKGISIKTIHNTLIEYDKETRKGNLTANKIFALLQTNSNSNVLFLDTDVICINPFDFSQLENKDICLKIEEKDLTGISCWSTIYNEMNLSFPGYVKKTNLDKVAIPPYYNSGVVYLNKNIVKQFCEMWLAYFIDISNHLLCEKSFYRDQIALALTLKKLKLNVTEMDDNWNFPFSDRKIPENLRVSFLHYHYEYLLKLDFQLKYLSNSKLLSKDIKFQYAKILRFLLRPKMGQNPNIIYKILRGY